MIALALLLAVQSPAPAPTTTTPSAPARPKLLVLDVKSGDLTKDQVESLTAVVAARAAKFGQVDVTSAQDVRELVQVEAEKQAAGCDGDSCLAEVAGAMGAQYVLATRAGKIGSSFVVTAQLYDAQKGEARARDTAETFSIDEVPQKLSTIVDGVLQESLGAPQAPLAKAPAAAAAKESAAAAEDGGHFDPLHLALQISGASALIAGGVLVVVGIAPAVVYGQKKAALNQATRDYSGKQAQLDEASKLQKDADNARTFYNGPGRIMWMSGAAIAILGGAALAAGFLLPPTEEMEGSL